MDVFSKNYGRVEAIVGPMYAGKTEELVRRATRETFANRKVLLCTKDTRHGAGRMVSHAGREMQSCYVEDATEILAKDLSSISVVGVDEGQFFGPHLKRVCLELAGNGKRIIVAGLDMDYLETPFENMAMVMAVAEFVTKLTAICVGCGEPATRSHRKVRSTGRYLEGAADTYEALCRPCFLERANAEGTLQQPDRASDG
jgi:thymidine kinase